jgi:FkbM family methyltransferase
MKNIFKKIKEIKKRIVKVEETDIKYQIGNYLILLPLSHKLPEYQSSFKNYDKKLKYIIQVVENHKKNGVVIDIGANVGDTTAYIRSFSNSKIYCIEGDAFYLEYLKKNVKIIPDVEIVDAYIAGRKPFGDFCVQRSNGTAKLSCLNVTENGELLKMITLQDMINDCGITPKSIELRKIDTDGFDFDILLANKEYIAIHKPALYFEYDISFNCDDASESIELIDFLQSIGYSFIVYDNFGNLLTVVYENATEVFTQLNHYLFSCRENGGGIYYFDVFTSINEDIVDLIQEKDNFE